MMYFRIYSRNHFYLFYILNIYLAIYLFLYLASSDLDEACNCFMQHAGSLLSPESSFCTAHGLSRCGALAQ